jgi:sec-independent protein translocase protein TatA
LGNHWIWLVLLLVVALIIFGPSRLPELGGALGRGIREFRKASEELRDEVTKPTEPASPPPAAPESEHPSA